MADDDELPSETEEQETEAAPEEEQQEAEPVRSDVDDLASEMGWRPKSEWDGPEDGWVDSRTFLKNTRDINRTLGRELKDLKRQMEGIGRATSQMTQRAVEAERQRLEKLHEQAVEDGDTKAAKEAAKAMQDLPVPQQDLPPEAQAFIERNSAWYGRDQEATTYAQKRSDHYAKEGLSPARQLAAVERDMRQHFPDLFPEDKPEEKAKAQPTLARPQRQATPQPREKGYATLPPAARKACDDFIAAQKEQGHTWASKDDWAANYYQQEATNG